MTAVAVTDPSSTFWRSIVYIESTFSNGAVFTGSGVMVGPNDVLTAGHVLYMVQQGGAATKVRVIPAYDPSPYSTPYGEVSSTSFHYFTDYDPQGTGYLMPGDGTSALAWSELDVGIIDLDSALGNQTGWMQIDPTFKSGTVNVTGFPAMYGRNMMTESGYGAADSVDSTIMYGGFDLSPGNSGGPVWRESGGSASVVGVVSTAGWGASVKGTYEQLMQWIASNDRLLPSTGTDQSGNDANPSSGNTPGSSDSAPAATEQTTPDTGGAGAPSAPQDGQPSDRNTPPQQQQETPTQQPQETRAPVDHPPSNSGSTPAEPAPSAHEDTPAPPNRPPSEATNTPPASTVPQPYDHIENGVAVFTGHRESYTIVREDSGYHVSGPQGTYTLSEVERIEFADGKVALDLAPGAAAANAVKVIGAALGAENVRLHPDWVGTGLRLFDQGLSVLDASQFALGTVAYQSRMPSTSNDDFVEQVYANVVGRAPSAAEHQYYLGWLAGNGGSMTQAELLAFAAGTDANARQVDIAGLQTTGVEYY